MSKTYYLLGYCKPSQGTSGHLYTRFNSISEAYSYYKSLDKYPYCTYDKIYIANEKIGVTCIYELEDKKSYVTIKEAKRLASIEKL